MADGVTVMSHSASLEHKTGVTMDRVCPFVLNWKLSCNVCAMSRWTKHYHVNSKSGVNFQVVLKQNHAKRNRIQRDLPVIVWKSYDKISFSGRCCCSFPHSLQATNKDLCCIQQNECRPVQPHVRDSCNSTPFLKSFTIKLNWICNRRPSTSCVIHAENSLVQCIFLLVYFV